MTKPVNQAGINYTYTIVDGYEGIIEDDVRIWNEPKLKLRDARSVEELLE